MLNLDTCGIEVSARSLLVQLRRKEETLPQRTFPNTSAGHRALTRFLRGKGRTVRICMESTGTYGLDLALALSAVEGLELMVANPKAVRRFAEALQVRSKTDPLDVVVLEQFARRMPLQLWRAPSLQVLQLRALTRRLQELAKLRTAEKNRLHAACATASTPEILRRTLERSIEQIDQAREALQLAASELLTQDSSLQRRYQLLLSVKGIGPLSALMILAEVSVLGEDLTAPQWVAFAGLDPRWHLSGTSVNRKPHLSRSGNLYLRRALYMPALVAVRYNPVFRDFYQRLLSRGKLPLQALCAAMRKLLHAIYGMFQHDQPFDPNRLFPSLQPATPDQQLDYKT